MFFFAVTVDEIEIKCERDDAGVLHCYKLYADSVTIFWAKANCASLVSAIHKLEHYPCH